MMKTGEIIINTDTVNVTNGKIIMNENNIPIEELLGSVTTINNIEGSETKSQQLRTSARVFKKMKLDSANATTPAIPEKKEPVKEEIKPPEIKKPVVRPLWTTEDKNWFFEALNDFGKDFEAIHSYISNKLKKKGLSENMIKTKDQVRVFYYRTWHKIGKHLKFSEEVKKVAQELYALINYGEMRRKLGSVSEKTCIKLNELIYRGYIAVRYRGKTVRIKTPMCRALRRLNQLDENHEELKLPNRILVELRAKDINAWMKVQCLAQNPRVRSSLPLHKRLSSLITCINNRWKTQFAAGYEKLLASANNVTNDCVPDAAIIEEKKALLEPPLRFSPPTDCNIQIPKINLSEYLTSHSICLNSYEERIDVKVRGEQLWLSAYFKATKGKLQNAKKGIKRPRNESVGEAKSPQKTNGTSNATDNNENCVNEPDSDFSVNEVVNEAVNTILALQNQQNQETADSKNDNDGNGDVKMEVDESNTDEAKIKEANIAEIRNGWTMHNCGSLSIGELYLMFGSNGKLALEYSWDPPLIKPKTEKSEVDIKTEENSDQVKNDDKVEAETTKNGESEEDLLGEKQEENSDKTANQNELTEILQRLLSVAKLHYRKNIVKCPCGHVCGETKQNSSGTNKNRSNNNSKNIKLNIQSLQEAPEKLIEIPEFQEIQIPIAPITSVTPVTIQPQPHIKLLSPMTVFQRPNSPTNNFLRAQIEKLRPFCNKRGRRPRSKPVIVERKLPLLAKGETGHQIVQMNIISQTNITTQRTIAPKVINSPAVTKDLSVFETKTNEPSTSFATGKPQDMPIISGPVVDMSDNAVTPSRVGSPTSISNLLDMALGSENNENKQTEMPNFSGFLSETIEGPTPPSSPSRILKENENQWINAEVADFSLSSFLGHLDSPVKNTQSSPSIVSEDTRMSQDVDAQLQSLLTETSIDYTAKFADLAAQVINDLKK